MTRAGTCRVNWQINWILLCKLRRDQKVTSPPKINPPTLTFSPAAVLPGPCFLSLTVASHSASFSQELFQSFFEVFVFWESWIKKDDSVFHLQFGDFRIAIFEDRRQFQEIAQKFFRKNHNSEFNFVFSDF